MSKRFEFQPIDNTCRCYEEDHTGCDPEKCCSHGEVVRVAPLNCMVHGFKVSEWSLRKKRLSDAECAAEYWRANAEYLNESWRYSILPDEMGSARVTSERASTWYRFATHPHEGQHEQA